MYTSNIFRISVLVFCALCLSACSTVAHKENASAQFTKDPLEKYNRVVYQINYKLDKAITRPLANGYQKIAPKPIKKGVSNFFTNLQEPWSIVNSLLQGKVENAAKSTYRFIVNSTIGIGGLFDVAKRLKVTSEPEDFGQTLAVWGVKPGPYIMLPLLGPTNLRDGISGFTQRAIFYPTKTIGGNDGLRIGLIGLNVINIREKLLKVDDILAKQIDPYAFLKLNFEKRRIQQIYDNQASFEEDFDF